MKATSSFVRMMLAVFSVIALMGVGAAFATQSSHQGTPSASEKTYGCPPKPPHHGDDDDDGGHHGDDDDDGGHHGDDDDDGKGKGKGKSGYSSMTLMSGGGGSHGDDDDDGDDCKPCPSSGHGDDDDDGKSGYRTTTSSGGGSHGDDDDDGGSHGDDDDDGGSHGDDDDDGGGHGCEPPPRCPPAATAPNQGNGGYVFKVDNPKVPTSANAGRCECKNPQPLAKVEGNLGRTIHVSASKPIDFVTIKSGRGAYLVSASWQIYSGTIKISKDVSNYVIWVCP